MGKSILIIGGGIAGLNAGIELLQNGYDVTIFEKNEEIGGLCSGYFVDGYSIDACLHWLMGTKPNTTLNAMWRNIDALNDDVEVSNLPAFCTFIYKGTKVTFGRNLDEEEARWKELSPQDNDAIKAFFESVRGLSQLWILTQSENHPRLSMKLISSLPNPGRILAALKQSRKDYARKFVHPALRFAIENAMTGYNNAFFFLQVYGLYASGDGDVPYGGAYAMVQRIKARFLSLGGKLRLNSPIAHLEIKNYRIAYAECGEEKIEADYYIAALDPHIAFEKLLDGKRFSLTYKNIDRNIEKHTVSGCFCVYIKVKDFAGDIATPTAIEIPKVRVGKKNVDALLVRPYAFDPLVQKEGGTVISLFVDQDQDDYAYFLGLKEREKEHRRIVDELVEVFLGAYPQYRGKTDVLDSFGPLELQEQTGTSYGSIQSYSFTAKGSFYIHPGWIASLENFYFCGQWNRAIGGTPTAMLASHDVVKSLLRKDRGPVAKGVEILSRITKQE